MRCASSLNGQTTIKPLPLHVVRQLAQAATLVRAQSPRERQSNQTLDRSWRTLIVIHDRDLAASPLAPEMSLDRQFFAWPGRKVSGRRHRRRLHSGHGSDSGRKHRNPLLKWKATNILHNVFELRKIGI